MSQYILDLSPEDHALMLAAHRAVVEATMVRDRLIDGFARLALPGNDSSFELSVEPNEEFRITERKVS